jgi:hypothetical protein
MKKLGLLLMVVLLGSATVTFANQPEPKETTSTKIHQLISKKVHYPTLASENLIEGDVYATVKINNDGSVVVQEANSLEKVLEKDVVKQLNRLTLDKKYYDPDNTYLLKFKFELTN